MPIIHNLQLIRLIASLIVLLFHFGPHYEAMGGNKFLVFIYKNLYFGTDVFMVMSGFIMMYITENKPHTVSYALKLTKKRFIRIFCSYYPLALFAAIIYYVYLPTYLNKIDWLNSLFLTSIDLQELILPVSWSLSFELYFYLLFSLWIILDNYRNKLVLPILFILILLLNIFFEMDGGSTFFLSPYLLEFIAGAIIFQHLSLIWKQNTQLLLVVSFALIAYGIDKGYNQGLNRVIFFGLASCCMLVGALALEIKKIWISPDILVKAGSASYIIYLAHYSLINLFSFTGLRSHISSLSSLQIEVSSVLFVLFVITSSRLYYRHVDLKIYSILLKRFY